MENKDRLFQIFSKKLRGVLGTLDVEPESLRKSACGSALRFLSFIKTGNIR